MPWRRCEVSISISICTSVRIGIGIGIGICININFRMINNSTGRRRGRIRRGEGVKSAERPAPP